MLTSKDGTHKIAIFDDPVMGAAAMFWLLSSKTYTNRTIQQAIAKWCGGFYVTTYLSVLEGKGKVNRSTLLTADLVRNPEIGIPLAKAMALQEAGREFPLSDGDWQRAHATAFELPPEAYEPAPVGEPAPVAGRPPVAPANGGDGAPLPEVAGIVVAEPAPAAPLSKSGTIAGVVGTGVGWAMTGLENTFQLALDWTSQLVAITPAQTALAAVGANGKAVGTGMAVGSLALVVTRRIRAGLEGKKG